MRVAQIRIIGSLISLIIVAEEVESKGLIPILPFVPILYSKSSTRALYGWVAEPLTLRCSLCFPRLMGTRPLRASITFERAALYRWKGI